jgi:hypothetical protein
MSQIYKITKELSGGKNRVMQSVAEENGWLLTIEQINCRGGRTFSVSYSMRSL